MFFFVFTNTWVSAQLNVSTNANASDLVSNIVAPGIAISNVSLNCNSQGSGLFTAGGTNLGLSSGILLSTGKAVDAIGPNNSGGIDNPSAPGCFDHSNNGNFYDPQLSSIEPKATFDGCVLEFDIKPVCNTINIHYVFASEEYPEFVCSDYNDVFGFFISGPNPAGGSYANKNIAQVPGTTIPVQINSINPGSSGQQGSSSNCVSLAYSNYYVDNAGGNTIQYDGFTTPLVAQTNVVPCAVYHIKLAIADAGDCIFDSGVFLAYHGITCPQAQVPAISSATTPVTCVSDGTATASVTNYTGTPVYNWQPGGQTTATATNLVPGTYTCTIDFSIPCPFTEKVIVNVIGQNVLTVTTSSTNAYCGNPTGTATAIVTGGIQPYTSYIWNTSPVQNSITATQLIPGNYILTVTDANNCVVSKPVTVFNTSPTITSTDSILNCTCNQANGEIFVNDVAGGTAPYSYSWATTPIQSTQNISHLAAATYTLTITDVNNCKATRIFPVINLANLPLDTLVSPERCFQHNGTATVKVLNGTPPYTYSWSQDPLLNSPTATNLSAGLYIVTVTDAIACTNKDSIKIININDIFNGNVYTSVPEPEVNVPFQLIITTPSPWALNYVLLPNNTISYDHVNDFLYEDYGNYQATFYVKSDNGCLDTIVYPFFVKDFMTIYIPNSFTPNKDILNETWYVYGTLIKEIKIYVFDRWGMKLFESTSVENGWDGTFKGKPVQEDEYVYKVEASDFYNKTKTFTGTITLIR